MSKCGNCGKSLELHLIHEEHGLTIGKARTFDAEAFDGGIVGFCLTEEEPAEPEAEDPTKAPAKKTGGRRKARAAS